MSASISEFVNAQKLTDGQVESLLAKLISLLPHSIPLTRRIQYERKHPSPAAHVFLAVRQDGDSAGRLGIGPDADEKVAWLIPPHSTWLAAYVDLAKLGETQCWVFASWEVPGTRYDFKIAQGLVNALCRIIKTSLVPLQPAEPSADWLLLRDTGKYLSQPYDRNKIKFGAVHDVVRQCILEDATRRTDASYGKYIFDLSAGSPSAIPLPDGYSFGDMTEGLLQTVLDRTPIPRTLQTLKEMLNVGLYFKGKAIGWGFLSKDGSLASLHTEPEHRGKGLAVAVGKELIRRQHEIFGDAGMEYVHADVSFGNTASNSVMKKLGGQVKWSVAWIEVDVSKVIGGA